MPSLTLVRSEEIRSKKYKEQTAEEKRMQTAQEKLIAVRMSNSQMNTLRAMDNLPPLTAEQEKEYDALRAAAVSEKDTSLKRKIEVVDLSDDDDAESVDTQSKKKKLSDFEVCKLIAPYMRGNHEPYVEFYSQCMDTLSTEHKMVKKIAEPYVECVDWRFDIDVWKADEDRYECQNEKEYQRQAIADMGEVWEELFDALSLEEEVEVERIAEMGYDPSKALDECNEPFGFFFARDKKDAWKAFEDGATRLIDPRSILAVVRDEMTAFYCKEGVECEKDEIQGYLQSHWYAYHDDAFRFFSLDDAVKAINKTIKKAPARIFNKHQDNPRFEVCALTKKQAEALRQ
jgi:hypothetical protein